MFKKELILLLLTMSLNVYGIEEFATPKQLYTTTETHFGNQERATIFIEPIGGNIAQNAYAAPYASDEVIEIVCPLCSEILGTITIHDNGVGFGLLGKRYTLNRELKGFGDWIGSIFWGDGYNSLTEARNAAYRQRDEVINRHKESCRGAYSPIGDTPLFLFFILILIYVSCKNEKDFIFSKRINNIKFL